jgi:putative alpha-1,2-mannosidase
MRTLPYALAAVCCLLSSCCVGQTASDLVNPLVGAAAQGQTFPIAGVLFAMTDWTPQTRDGEKKSVAPYYATDTHIQGFRGSHFLSGSCTRTMATSPSCRSPAS